MIKRALDIKEVLKNFLKYTDLKLSDKEWNLLEELYRILSPVKDVVNVICRRNADLLIAEVVFQELFDVLEKIGTPLAKNYWIILKLRLKNVGIPKQLAC